MQGIRGAAAVPEKDELAAAAQGGCGFLRELRDPADQFIGKTLLYASAFLELAANLFDRRGHCSLAENDFFAVAHYAPCGVARIDDQLCSIGDRRIVITRMIGGDDYRVIASERLRIEWHGFHAFVIEVPHLVQLGKIGI